MAEAQPETQPLLAHEDIVVWPIIHMIRGDVIVCFFIPSSEFFTNTYMITALHRQAKFNTPLTLEALTGPDLTYTLVRPLEEKYNAIQRAGNKSVVFCFLLNRVHFIRDQKNLTTGPLSCSRAMLCEILAIRCLRDNGSSMLNMALVLTTKWQVWSGADPHIVEMAREERDDDLEERVGNAIEMAIISKARRFIKSSPCQKVIDGIWIGKCVYQAESSHSILSDTYKYKPIHFYDPHKAPLLDHYRLKVPAIRSVLDYFNFLVLFILFVVAIELNEPLRINIPETLFMLYGLGFALEKLATIQEHGITVYFKGTWFAKNGFDLAFVTTYCVYAFFRLYGVYGHKHWAQDLGIDFLAVIACLMFPRLAFVTFKNNLMVLSLRAMMMQFVALMLIAAFCFCGFLLSRNHARYSAGTIAWWMLDLWFGLDASGFDKAFEFDFVFGPILMITYACLSNTLLLTVLVSILSNTFARINEDAAAEAMFRRAVSTIEGQVPPVNLLALCILLPSSYVLSPRWFHKVNVFMIRATNFPILLIIALYERQSKKTGSNGFYETITSAAEKVLDTLPRPLKRMSFFEGLVGSGSTIDVIFEVEEQMDNSALDTRDCGELPPAGAMAQRRPSRKSDYQTSLRPRSLKEPQSQLQPLPRSQPELTSTHARPLLPQQPGPLSHQVSHSSSASTLRRRVNSQISRADITQSISPLVQVFQPLIVDDVDDDPKEGTPHSAPAPLVSYGPASRRLASMQSMMRPDPIPIVQRRPPLPVINTRPEIFDGPGSPSTSPQQSTQPETAEEAEESSFEDRSMVRWLERMKRMEDRQKRIEELLLELVGRAQRV
ncbi:uncharacterized protein BJ212DRAFT_1484952 [Suillus subaureus]|uniref:Ion transport domain-containing protein n=1 Tax=Suillus subaureus TaxID=48587 RepID=A0A9P7E1A0_9AGAM|nr:uncharacterized protein BJ212DRAFT_1484952 [Suillus subaureus]KAG1808712.1 hypothetical protein BJ212DRAFT_1484952 [Suillus subaureus]